MAKKQARPDPTPAEEQFPAPEAEAAAPAAPKNRGPKGVPDSATLTVLVSNPKRAGSKAEAVFNLYETGLSISALMERATATEGIDLAYVTPCLVYDAKHGFISIDGYDPGEIVQPKPKAEKAPKEPRAPRGKKAAKAEAADPEVEAEAQTETMD